MMGKRIQKLGMAWLIAGVLTGCADSAPATVRSIPPSTEVTESTEAGPSPVKATSVHAEGQIPSDNFPAGEPSADRYSTSISAEGSHMLYNRQDKKVPPAQVVCDLMLLDLESGEETRVGQNNEAEPCHAFSWLGEWVYVQWNEFPSRRLTDFSLFDGKAGKLLESGRLYQYLEESETRIVLLLPRENNGDGDSLGADIRIGALTNDGAFHHLDTQNVYEVQFLDIQLSESLDAMAIWTHHVPTNTSQLLIARVDTALWSTGEWALIDIEPNPDGGTIGYDQDGFVILSDGRRFKLPWLV
jgi:hypothetical protein